MFVRLEPLSASCPHSTPAAPKRKPPGREWLGGILFGYLAGRYTVEFPFRYAPLVVAFGLIVQLGLLHHGKTRMTHRESERITSRKPE